MLRILPEPQSSQVLLHQSSFNGVVSLSDVEDEGNLVASELEEIIVDICECVRTFDTYVI